MGFAILGGVLLVVILVTAARYTWHVSPLHHLQHWLRERRSRGGD
jgi:hypothetical protein